MMTVRNIQDGIASPNPSFQQDIEVVRGKNRFDGELLPNSYNPTTGEIEASSTSYRSNKIPLQKNETYYLSGITGNVRVLYWNNTSYVSSEVITMPNSFITKGNIIAFQFDKSLSHENIMIEKGSQATSYLPYNTLEVVERGNNLFDKNAVTNGYYVNAGTGELSSGTSAFNASDFIPVSTGDYVWGATTTTGYSLVVYDKDKHYVRSVGRSITQQIKITIAENEKYVRYTVSTVDLDTQQFERGATQSTYEPYQTPQTYQLSLGEYEFAKIGNYVDTIEYDVDEDKVYKNEKVGKIVLDGSSDENWQMDYSTGFVSNRFTCDNLPSLDVTSQTNFDYGYCNIGKITSEAYYSTYLNVVKLRYINNQNRVDCMFDIESLNAFKTLLAQTPMEIYYQRLGGAELTEITDTTLKQQVKNWYYSQSFNGTTIIEIDGQLPLIIKVRALKGE